jgi:hypothetical protein
VNPFSRKEFALTTKLRTTVRSVAAILLLIAFVLQGTTSVLAGTTGSITGTVADASTGKAVAGARVTATSPSQSATTTSDTAGRFSFVSLAPDTYTLAIAETTAYDAASISGVTVQADQTVNVSIGQPTKLKVIGAVTSRAASALVKPGTTADVYSINAVTQDKASALGGGGALNSAWSAISSVPGVYVAPNQNGYIGAAATLSIRGGNYDQIGYELDGIPVNRAFDNYPSGSLSSLGQQELQIYTGAPAANAEANGISGYINQVIRTGTAPASRNATLATGFPAFYGKLAFEAGGANPSRTFSYYIGAGAYNQDFRAYDQYNGASLNQNWGAPLAACDPASVPRAVAPSCYGPHGEDYTNGGATPAYVLGPYQYGTVGRVRDRDTVANFHFGLPRKDGNRDDIQLLFSNNFIDNVYYNSTNDAGGTAYMTAIGAGVPFYLDGYQFTGAPLGTVFSGAYGGGGAVPYLYPDSPGGRAFRAPIAPDRRDAFTNDQAIVKLQYQHNFGTNAFLRVYGYTYYSDWLQNAPQSTYANFIGPLPAQYLLDSHSRGVSAHFSDQINSQHLISLQGAYTTASTMRYNNSGIAQTGGVGYLVDATNPYAGTCYNPDFDGSGAYAGTKAAAPCVQGGSYAFTLRQAYTNTVVPAATFGTCGGGPCRYVLALNGISATFNTVVPKFYALSVSDQWKPGERWNVNLGLRLDRFEFDGADTTNGGAARVLWYNAWNLAHPANQLVNVPNQVQAYNEWQPRAGFTYTLSPSTVLRASYGRYAEAPNAAFEQYNYLQANSPPALSRFGAFGLPTTPGHPVRPEVSNNYDMSLEHQFNRDTSMKLTPFLRKTQDQIQQFYLNQKTSFISGLNVGRQTSEGVEFELDKGDFSRNGLAARLTFTYTNSYINYTKLGGGLSVVDGYNQAIAGYNAYTHAGGGAPCYTLEHNDASGNLVSGAADPSCAAGSIANPYYNAPIQPLMDPNGNYATFALLPGGIGGAPVTAYGAPFVGTLMLQYKKGPFTITPAVQFAGGTRYGVPESTPGVNPEQCLGGLGGSPGGDPRYPYGAPGGAPFDATQCAAGAVIPNMYTGRFDNIGAFVAPNTIQLHTQIAYDVNKRLTLVGNFANIVNRCWGGTKVPFAVNHACNYAPTFGAGTGPQPVGNAFNPGWKVQPLLSTPYDPVFPGLPFNMYVEARIKL